VLLKATHTTGSRWESSLPCKKTFLLGNNI
jgi:hypothetical protein